MATGIRTGLVLLAHGARDPRWAEPLVRLRERIVERSPGLDVELAFLELLEPDVVGAVGRLAAAGCSSVTVVPVFLGQGGHVRQDVPERIAAARQRFPEIVVSIAAPVGDDAAVIDALATCCLSSLTD